MRSPLLLVLACVALVAGGCGERSEPLARDLTPYPVTVRGAGEDVAVERLPERIVALSSGAAELVEELGAGERLVGVPAGFGRGDAPSVVRPSGLVDTARVAALRPDLVLAATQTNREELERALEGTRAVIYVQPDRSLRDVVRATLELGLLIDAGVEARKVAARVRDAAARVERRVRELPTVRVFVDLGFFVAPTPDSIVADLVRRAGGELVGLEIPGPPEDACDVLALRPEVVLVVADPAQSSSMAAEFAACGGAQPRVEPLPASLVTAAGPRAGEALEAVFRALRADAR